MAKDAKGGRALKKALQTQLGVLRGALAATLVFSDTVIPDLGRLGDRIGQASLPEVLEVEIRLLEEALRKAGVTYNEKRLGIEKHPIWLLRARARVEFWGEQKGRQVSLTADDLATLMDVIYLLNGADSAEPVDPASVRVLMARFLANPRNAKMVEHHGFRKRQPDTAPPVKDTKPTET